MSAYVHAADSVVQLRVSTDNQMLHQHNMHTQVGCFHEKLFAFNFRGLYFLSFARQLSSAVVNVLAQRPLAALSMDARGTCRADDRHKYVQVGNYQSSCGLFHFISSTVSC